GPAAAGARAQAARPAAQAAASPVAAAGQGLDALSDEAVMTDLAGRGVNSLLNRLFDERRVPPADREGFKALPAIRELGVPAPLSNAKRIALVKQCTDGLAALLPKLSDPDTMMGYAATLISRGIEPDVNVLEYWGDHPATQARVRPAAKVAVDLLTKASETATARAAAIANQIKKPDDPRVEQYVKLDELANQSRYVAALTAYYEVIGIDAAGPDAKAAMDQRRKLADPAIKHLAQFDNPDSGIGPLVKLRLGKLCLAKADYAAAKRHFQAVANKKMVGEDKKTPVEMAPPPSDLQQNEARYFAVVADVLAKKPAEAEKAAADLAAWQKATLPDNAATQAAIGAPMAMLGYRIAAAKAAAAPAGADRDALAKAADERLTKLGEQFPAFQSLITELLVSKLPDDTDLSKQGVPVLLALEAMGNAERYKPEGAAVDQKALARALEAARVMAAKKPGDGGATAQHVEDATVLTPAFLERLGKPVEAADLYLDYGTDKRFAASPMAATAVDRAVYLADTQYRAKPQDQAVRKLYARALEVAANAPFNRREAFLPFANWLRVMGDHEKAVTFFRRVPKGDRQEFDARYFELLSTRALLDKAKDPALRAQRGREMAGLIAQVRPLAQAAVTAAAADPARSNAARFRLANVDLLSADLALQQNNPKAAVAALDGFEQKVAGLPAAEALLNRALPMRTVALVNLGQIDQAIQLIQALAGKKETAPAAFDLARDVLDRLTTDLDRAKRAGDAKAAAEVAANRSKMTGVLTQLAQNHPDERIRKRADEFAVYDAATKREAAEMTPDPAQKKALATAALTAFGGLRPKVEAANNPGLLTRIDFGMAACELALGNHQAAADGFGKLIATGRLGGATVTEPDPAGGGGVVTKDNPSYWEGMYKWNRANLELAKKNADSPLGKKLREGAERSVKDLFITNRDKTGGDNWDRQFVELRNEVAPGWEPGVPASGTAAPAAPAATQPGA
ncbi:MAG: hypothetical protein JWO31_434, partial [Phycisphaerales bacterium]|nr:hypothetical protein [Phycisphaerales bacterium]